MARGSRPRLNGGQRGTRLVLFAGVWALVIWVLLPHALSQIVYPPAVPFWAGFDTLNYWAVWRLGIYHGAGQLYGAGDYLYSPAFAQTIWPLTLLPYEIFRVTWAVPALITYGWLLQPAPWSLRVPLGILAGFAVLVGNIEWLLGLIVLLAGRAPWAWALPALTKVTPVAGILWYLGRGDRHAFVVAVSASLAVATASFVLAPDQWIRWIEVLRDQNHLTSGLIGLAPLPIRLAIASVLALWSGRRSSRLGLLAVVFLAQPDINYTTLALFCAAPRALDADRSNRIS